LPEGEVGTVVTYLEMTVRPPLRASPSARFQLTRWKDPQPARYRLLFERIGARWLWYSRLAMSDAALEAAIGELYVVLDARGIEVGMIELSFDTPSECLIAFLGLIPELSGQGHGKWLLAQTLTLAWRKGIERVHVHTCMLDHPAAMRAYLAAGFNAYRRAFESFPDPRLKGLLPRECAPQIPLIEQ
jgi:GNAT superfamily N-acetyltransferase